VPGHVGQIDSVGWMNAPGSSRPHRTSAMRGLGEQIKVMNVVDFHEAGDHGRCRWPPPAPQFTNPGWV
jgi:hypothetical protein